MKTQYTSVLAAMVLLGGATGCSDDFLEVSSPTQVSIEEYFTTEEHIQEALIAAYDPLQWTDWSCGQYSPLNVMSEIMSDNLYVGGADKNDNAFWHLMANYESIPTQCLSSLWTEGYSGVKRSNDVITYLDWAGDKIDANVAKNIKAQALTLRCYYYSWLWKFWGNIPYFESNLDFPYLTKQLPADEVYANVVATMEEVIALDALPMVCTGENIGRITKAMLYMLYTEFVMYQNDESRFAKALSYMNEIIASGKYALYDDFAGIWRSSGEWSSESIFEINYKNANGVRSWDWTMGAGGTVIPRLIGPYSWPDGTLDVINGWGFCPVPTEVYEMYEATDVRRDATCFNVGDTKYNKRYQDTGFFLGKYLGHTEDTGLQLADADLNFENNLRIYRYSEVLLNAAELIVRGAGSGDAKALLDQVRVRAGVASVEASLDNILNERRLEFVGEGKRYWDLIRSGKAASVLVPDEYGYRTNTWSPAKKYLPIPQSEIDAAQNTLSQNEGY